MPSPTPTRFGELSSGNEGYYLATAFDEIELQAVGLVGLTGLGAQVPLARDLLASLGIDFEVFRRAEYKTAMESLTDSQLTGPNREQLEALLDTLNGQLVDGIAEGRKLPPERSASLIDRGPFSADEARAARLVDALRYGDEIRSSCPAPGRCQAAARSTLPTMRPSGRRSGAGGQRGPGARRRLDQARRRLARSTGSPPTNGRRAGRDRRRSAS